MGNKILVGTIFSNVKDYVIRDWYDHVCKFTFPGFDVCAIDNSTDKKYHKEIFRSFSERSPGSPVGNLTVLHTTVKHKQSEVFMSFSYNELRNHFLVNGYDILVLIESDQFPELDIIERLISYDMQIVSGLFFTGDKKNSYPMIAQTDYYLRGPQLAMLGYLQGFYDIGEVEVPKPVASAGLGCVLIYKDILQAIPFRYDPEFRHHPDTMFATDLFENNIKNFYVPLFSRHENQTWDIQRQIIADRT